jgi:hypothetical protein
MDDPLKNQGFIKAEKVIENVLIQNNKQRILYFSKIRKYWDVIVGEPLSKKTAPGKLVKKTLHVMVMDSAYSHQLRFFEKRILELIDSPEICGESVVKKIVFKVDPDFLTQDKHPKAKQEERPQPPIPPEIFERSEKAESRIRDTTLRNAFGRFMAKTLFNVTSDK